MWKQNLKQFRKCFRSFHVVYPKRAENSSLPTGGIKFDAAFDISRLQERIQEVDKKRLSLDEVFYIVSMTNYSSVEQLQSDYEQRMNAIYQLA